jgi:hypothetical protein
MNQTTKSPALDDLKTVALRSHACLTPYRKKGGCAGALLREEKTQEAFWAGTGRLAVRWPGSSHSGPASIAECTAHAWSAFGTTRQRCGRSAAASEGQLGSGRGRPVGLSLSESLARKEECADALRREDGTSNGSGAGSAPPGRAGPPAPPAQHHQGRGQPARREQPWGRVRPIGVSTRLWALAPLPVLIIDRGANT